jgi:chromate transporter
MADVVATRAGGPTARALFWAWARIGAFSFGGGSSTLFLIRREFVEVRGWLDEVAFREDYALSKLVPGINIIAQAILIGRRIAGGWGAVAAVVGLLLPAVIVPTILAATIAWVERFHAAQAALGGVIPATAGLTLALTVQLVGRSDVRTVRLAAIAAVAIVVAALLIGLLHLPVPVVLLVFGLVGAAFPHAVGIPPQQAAPPIPSPDPDVPVAAPPPAAGAVGGVARAERGD